MRATKNYSRQFGNFGATSNPWLHQVTHDLRAHRERNSVAAGRINYTALIDYSAILRPSRR
jgi:hypothetical protein